MNMNQPPTDQASPACFGSQTQVWEYDVACMGARNAPIRVVPPEVATFLKHRDQPTVTELYLVGASFRRHVFRMVVQICPQPMSMLELEECGDVRQSCCVCLVVIPLAFGS